MNLDKNQQQAVETTSKKALVLSGAGSGKTRVLIERIAHLLEEKKVAPSEIMAFTFTRKAAKEIQDRLETRIGPQAHKVQTGTMHGVALGLLWRFGEYLDYKPKSITVYGQWETDFLIKEVAADLGLFKKTWKIPKKKMPGKKSVDGMFADYYERGLPPSRDHPGKTLFHEFTRRCRENNALTYGALLIGLFNLLPLINRFLTIRHILVDEVQDIDSLQWQIIEDMQSCFDADLFVVGDIDQSIYGFRGAIPNYLVNRLHTFDLYRAENNYRSDPAIINAANRLIQHNTGRIEFEMKAVKESIEQVNVIKEMDSAAIAVFLTPFITPTAVLARNHFLLKKLSKLLDEVGVEHSYVGSKTKLVESEPFRRFHAFLKLTVNPYDNFSFLLIRDLVGLTKIEYSMIREKAVKEGKSHFKVWRETHRDQFIDYYDSVDRWEMDGIVNKLYFMFDDDRFSDSALFINPWLADHLNGTVAEYLSWLATYGETDEIKESNEIQLMTIHAAKGLEFSTVIIAGCNEGILPSKQSRSDVDKVNDERRLMYVAMTRAEKLLVCTVRPEKKEYKGKITFNPVSRFLKEAGV